MATWALASAATAWACAGAKQAAAPSPEPAPVVAPAAPVAQAPARVVDTVMVKDPELQRRLERLELSQLEREAQIEDLETKLDEARREVVRAMARLQTLATRAEAASALAEAEVAHQALRPSAGQPAIPGAGQAKQLLDLGTAEFDRQNYGGALYLANQAKGVATAAKGRLASGEWGTLRAGELMFVVPLRLRTAGRANVREGPGASFKVTFTLDGNSPVSAISYADQWVHVRDESGRSGWIAYALLARRPDARR